MKRQFVCIGNGERSSGGIYLDSKGERPTHVNSSCFMRKFEKNFSGGECVGREVATQQGKKGWWFWQQKLNWPFLPGNLSEFTKLVSIWTLIIRAHEPSCHQASRIKLTQKIKHKIMLLASIESGRREKREKGINNTFQFDAEINFWLCAIIRRIWRRRWREWGLSYEKGIKTIFSRARKASHYPPSYWALHFH